MLPTLPHMQSSMTVMILSMTASSPDESLASNLQFEMVELSSASAESRSTVEGDMRPQTKKLCNAERDADVIGPVDRGDRMMAKNGARMVLRDSFPTSMGDKFQ